MPVVHNFTTIQKMQHDDARDIVEFIQAKSVIDDKIERNDMQDEIQSEKDHTNPVVQELAIREEEAERQALEDKFLDLEARISDPDVISNQAEWQKYTS